MTDKQDACPTFIMDDLEYNYIKHQVLSLTGIDLNCYKAPQMQRRLKAYLPRVGFANWPKFFRFLRDTPAELGKFRDYLTINVSYFFRDAEKYKYLQNSILPDLLRRRSALRIWSAGCSHGQEAYSLFILLNEAKNFEYQHQILATDIDASALEWARAGGPYTLDEISNVSPDLRLRYFTVSQNKYWINEPVRQKVSFRQHNILADPIASKFDLVICRNVVIYFETEAKESLYKRLADAIRPGGILFVGGTEIVPRPMDIELEMINVSFYRRQEPGQPAKTARK